MSGMLSLCATPIGNLEDITLRVIRTLKEADRVYAEDTRHTRGLLSHLQIKKPLISCHEHNENERAAEIVDRVRSGERIAYVSDAGMPGISDPGAKLAHAAIEEGIPFEVLPGASALPMAAVLSGLDIDRLLFLGFLPRTNKERRELLLARVHEPCTMILYESPQRVAETLAELCEYWGDRSAALMRELTKLYEETRRGTLRSLAEECSATLVRGECVIAVAGAGPDAKERSESPDEMLLKLLSQGMSVKDAAKQASAVLEMPKNEAYELALRLQSQRR
ncbi:MAG: 16S rRNA (cytidine(1402)-2'-O)-methyltransferase [Bacillota bacterium]